MKTYNGNEIKGLHPKSWAAWCNGTTTIVKAYLKENAVKRFQEIDLAVIESDVYLYHSINSGAAPVDEVKELQFDTYQIVYRS